MDALRRLAVTALEGKGDRGPLMHLQRAMGAPSINPCPESLLRTKLPWEEEKLMIEAIGGRSDGASTDHLLIGAASRLCAGPLRTSQEGGGIRERAIVPLPRPG